MLTSLATYPNQAYGLPVQVSAKKVPVKWKATKKVNAIVVPEKKVNAKQK